MSLSHWLVAVCPRSRRSLTRPLAALTRGAELRPRLGLTHPGAAHLSWHRRDRAGSQRRARPPGGAAEAGGVLHPLPRGPVCLGTPLRSRDSRRARGTGRWPPSPGCTAPVPTDADSFASPRGQGHGPPVSVAGASPRRRLPLFPSRPPSVSRRTRRPTRAHAHPASRSSVPLGCPSCSRHSAPHLSFPPNKGRSWGGPHTPTSSGGCGCGRESGDPFAGRSRPPAPGACPAASGAGWGVVAPRGGRRWQMSHNCAPNRASESWALSAGPSASLLATSPTCPLITMWQVVPEA